MDKMKFYIIFSKEGKNKKHLTLIKIQKKYPPSAKEKNFFMACPLKSIVMVRKILVCVL